jgi:uncharacterized protein
MRILLYLTIGFTIGSASGAMGIGGGILLVPALIWLCGFEPSRAAGTSLAVLVPPIGLPAAWKYYANDRMDLVAAVWIASGFTVGAYIGATVVHYLPEQMLRLFFGAVMIYVALRFMLDSSPEAAKAAGGSIAFGFAWLAYFGFRALGRKHTPPPDLGSHIRAKDAAGWGEADYHI